MQLKPEHKQLCRPPTALITENQYTLYPAETLLITAKMPHLMDHDATGILTPSAQYDQHDTIFVVSTLSTVNNNAVAIQLTNSTDIPYTVPNETHIADFTVLSPEQIKYVKPVNPGELNFMMHQFHDETDQYIHQLLRVPTDTPEPEQYWFPTPEQP